MQFSINFLTNLFNFDFKIQQKKKLIYLGISMSFKYQILFRLQVFEMKCVNKKIKKLLIQKKNYTKYKMKY